MKKGHFISRQTGVKGFTDYAKRYGAPVSESEAKRALKAYRATYRELSPLWHRDRH